MKKDKIAICINEICPIKIRAMKLVKDIDKNLIEKVRGF